MAYKRISPIPVVEGGSGAQTLTGVLIGNGSSAFTASAITQFDTLVAGASNTITSIAPSATVGVPLVSGGSSANPSYGTAVVAGGGTGQTTLTLNAVLVGNSTTGILQIGPGTTNQVLLGNTSAAPSFGQVPNGALVNDTVTLANGNNITVTGSPVALGGSATINVSGTTNNTIQVGNASGSLTSLAAATNGQIPIGSTGAAPVMATITAGANVTVTNGAGSITIAASGGGGGGITTLTADSGSATGSSVLISGGSTGLTTTASGSSLDITGTLDVANGGTGAVTLTGVLIGNGTSAVTGNAVTQFDVLVGGASNAITSVAPSATSGVPLISAGSSANPSFGTAVVAGGGTGNTTFTAYSVICAGTTATGAFQNVSGVGTSGQALVSNGASALPTWQTVSGGGETWTVVTGATQALAINNGYIANNGGTSVMTLPSTAAVGSIIEVTGINNATGWQIAQNSGQTIHFGAVNTTTGTGGSLASSATSDSVRLLCVIANTDWNVLSSIGNITYV